MSHFEPPPPDRRSLVRVLVLLAVFGLATGVSALVYAELNTSVEVHMAY